MLWLLLVIPPALVAFLWWSARERERLMTQFIQARLLPSLVAGVSPQRQKFRAAALVAAVVCLLLALARPQWGFDWQEVTQRGLDIVVAIDTSKSMLAEDIAPNRLARAKLAALDLMQQAKSDRLGLVAFAGSAFLQCPLTIDDSAFRQSLEALDVNIIPDGGTAIGEAIDEATRAFKEGENHKVVVLFTDGEDHDSEALAAAKKAKEAGVLVFTIGIGSAEGELLHIKNAEGQSDFVRDENGNVVKSRLNEGLLQQIAGATDAFYLPLRGAGTIDTLYQKGIAPLPKSDEQEKLVKRPIERYHWPLAVAMLLLIFEMLFPERKSSKSKTAGAPAGAAALLFGALLMLPMTSSASPASALRDYQAGRFAEAQQEYERLAAEDKQGDPRFIFNAGTAAFRQTNYDDAIKFFTTATAATDLKLQSAAYFNIGNAQFRQGQSAKLIDDMEKHWQAALKSYQNAVSLNREDRDAALNLEYTRQCLEYLKQLREVVKQAQAAAQRNDYNGALKILTGLMEQLKGNPFGKSFEEYVQKLGNIDAIANPKTNQP
ncbi:MAG: VWA domain-containing protein [Verrucomicrobiota bacterium]